MENKEKKKTEEKKHEKINPLKEKDEKIKELTDMLQRMQAEMENYKKRCDKDADELRKYCQAELVSKLLPVIDSFELALKHTENKIEFEKGIKLIFSQIIDTLEKEGLRQIDCMDKKFDPYKHEVLLTEKTEDDNKEDTITEELQKGYMFKDRVLRYSKVKVFKK